MATLLESIFSIGAFLVFNLVAIFVTCGYNQIEILPF